jgi:hypothetical protein
VGDHISANIVIGGKITQADVEEFADILTDEVGEEYGCTWDREEAMQAIREAIDTKSPLTGVNNEADFGRFPRIVEFCKERELTYHHTAEAKWEYDGETTFYSPETGEIELSSNQNEELTTTIRELEAAVDMTQSDHHIAASLREFLERFDLPDVPPLELIDG